MSSYYTRYNNSKNMLSGSNIKPIEAAGILAAIQARTSDAYILGCRLHFTNQISRNIQV